MQQLTKITIWDKQKSVLSLKSSDVNTWDSVLRTLKIIENKQGGVKIMAVLIDWY